MSPPKPEDTRPARDGAMDQSGPEWEQRREREKRELAQRKELGLIDTQARSDADVNARLSKPQQALREAAISHFKSNKLKSFIAGQIEYVNGARQVGEGIRFLFDRDNRPPANMPLEEVVSERKRIERNLAWLEAICAELRNSLVAIREIEDDALDLLEMDGEQ